MKKILLLSFIVLSLLSDCYATETLQIDSDGQYNFAEHYFSDGEYFKAISEYERFIHFFPDDYRVETAMHRIGTALMKSGHFKEAVAAFRGLIEKYQFTPLAVESYFNISDVYMKLKEPDAAISVLENFIAETENKPIRDKNFHKEKAIYAINHISELKRAALNDRKSPALAGWLSVIPGAGLLYCGRYQDALTAFLLNTGLILASYESFRDHNYALGSVIGFVGLGFYTGNIYGAVSGAHKYNKDKIAELNETFSTNTFIGFSGDKGVMLSFRVQW